MAGRRGGPEGSPVFGEKPRANTGVGARVAAHHCAGCWQQRCRIWIHPRVGHAHASAPRNRHDRFVLRTGCAAIVNEAAASALFDGDAVGRSIEDPSGQRVQIVGVVAIRKAANTAAARRPTIYFYAEQTGTPLGRVGPARFRVPVRPRPASGVLDANVVSPSYFGAMGLLPAAGGLFPDDPAPRGCRVGVINEEAAELYFGGPAVGGAVIDRDGRRTEIVGVVRPALLRASQRRVEPAIDLPMAQDFLPRMTRILGARDPTDAVVASVRRRLDVVAGGAPGGAS